MGSQHVTTKPVIANPFRLPLTLHEGQTSHAMRQWSRVHQEFGHVYVCVVPLASHALKPRLRGHGGIVESLKRIPRGTHPLDALYHQLSESGSDQVGHRTSRCIAERLLETYEQPSIPDTGNTLVSAAGLSRPKMAPQGLHSMRTSHPKDADIVEVLATDVLKTGWLLCFVEFLVQNEPNFFVPDIADAMLLKRLLASLFKGGGIMVASSNRAPTELYKNGIQRELFLPCIELIKSRCQVFAFRPQASDYRLIGARPEGSRALDKIWHLPLDNNAIKIMQEALDDPRYKQAAADRAIGRTILKEGSRIIGVPKAAGGVAAFAFQELCGTAEGAADYLAIASSFHRIFISDIPRLTRIHSELARRFITLVDVFYEQKVKVIVSAGTDPGGQISTEGRRLCSRNRKADAGSPSSGPKYVESDEEFA